MPALPSWLIDPLWDQFAALLPERAADHPAHPLGCHRPHVADRVVFDKLVHVLVLGCGDRRIEDAACSATTLRDRRDEWIALGIFDELELLVLHAYDRMIGLELGDLAIDGCITKAPCGGDAAGRSPVDRGKQGRKQGRERSTVTDGRGIPLGAMTAGANRHDSPLLAATLDTQDRLGKLGEQRSGTRRSPAPAPRSAVTPSGLRRRRPPRPLAAARPCWPSASSIVPPGAWSGSPRACWMMRIVRSGRRACVPSGRRSTTFMSTRAAILMLQASTSLETWTPAPPGPCGTAASGRSAWQRRRYDLGERQDQGVLAGCRSPTSTASGARRPLDLPTPPESTSSSCQHGDEGGSSERSLARGATIQSSPRSASAMASSLESVQPRCSVRLKASAPRATVTSAVSSFIHL